MVVMIRSNNLAHHLENLAVMATKQTISTARMAVPLELMIMVTLYKILLVQIKSLYCN